MNTDLYQFRSPGRCGDHEQTQPYGDVRREVQGGDLGACVSCFGIDVVDDLGDERVAYDGTRVNPDVLVDVLWLKSKSRAKLLTKSNLDCSISSLGRLYLPKLCIQISQSVDIQTF